MLYYPSLRVRLTSSLLVKEPLPAFVLHGSNGSFIKTRGDIQEADLIAGKQPGTFNWGIEPESNDGLLHILMNGKDSKQTVSTLPGNYGMYYEKLHQSMIHSAMPPVTADEGIRVMQILEAAVKSHETQTVVTL